MFSLSLFLLLAQITVGALASPTTVRPRWSYDSSTPWWHYTTPRPRECEKPFVEISGRCVFVDPFLKGSWIKSRYMCHELSAELAIIDNAQFFHDLLKFIRSEGIDQESYWIGGSDDEVEGEWRWVDGKTVEFGSPFWALMWSDGVYSLRPGNNIDRNCLSLDSQKFLYFQDQVCSNEQAAICERTRHLQ